MTVLRATTARDVYIVTDPRLMRGFDYRSADGHGIALLMCNHVDSEREANQALGRVGRYGDRGERAKLISNIVNLDRAR